jgi:hypothetical protein
MTSQLHSAHTLWQCCQEPPEGLQHQQRRLWWVVPRVTHHLVLRPKLLLLPVLLRLPVVVVEAFDVEDTNERLLFVY